MLSDGYAGLTDLAAALAQGEVTSAALVRDALSRIEHAIGQTVTGGA